MVEVLEEEQGLGQVLRVHPPRAPLMEPVRPRESWGKWEHLLSPLIDRPGRWEKVATMGTVRSAQAQVSRLRNRRVAIPQPMDSWEFGTTGPMVYARYLGPPGV